MQGLQLQASHAPDTLFLVNNRICCLQLLPWTISCLGQYLKPEVSNLHRWQTWRRRQFQCREKPAHHRFGANDLQSSGFFLPLCLNFPLSPNSVGLQNSAVSFWPALRSIHSLLTAASFAWSLSDWSMTVGKLHSFPSSRYPVFRIGSPYVYGGDRLMGGLNIRNGNNENRKSKDSDA